MSSANSDDGQEQTLVQPLIADAAVDVIGTSAHPPAAQQSGLRFRAFNDIVHVRVLPAAGSRITLHGVRQRLTQFVIDLDKKVETEIVSTLVQDQRGSMALIAVPPLGSGHEQVINMRIIVDHDHDGDERVVLEFAKVLGAIVDDEPLRLDELADRHFTFSPEVPQVIICSGNAGVYRLVLWTNETSPSQFSVRQNLTEGSIQLISCADGRLAFDLALGISPMRGEHRLAGYITASLVESPFVYVIYPPLGPENLHWIACLLQPGTVPLSHSAPFTNRYPIPYIGFATDEGHWALGTHQPHGSHPELVVCLVGRPEVDHIRSLVEGQAYRRIYIITDDANPTNYLSPFGLAPASVPPHDFAFVQVSDTQVAVATPEWTAEGMERMNSSLLAIEFNEEPFNDFHRQTWHSVIADRLPRLPVVPDPRVAPICVLINLIRGRVPDSTRQTLSDGAGIFADDLWLAPWDDLGEIHVDQLAVELIVRSSSEYVAIQLVQALDLNQAEASHDGPASASARRELAELIDACVRSQSSERAHCYANARAALAQEGIGRRAAISLVAEHLYRVDPDERYATGMSFTNPFVVALIDTQTPWHMLSLDQAYRVLYAACQSRVKVGAFLPIYTNAAKVAGLKDALRSLRTAFHDIDAPQRHELIREQRRTIGKLTEETIGPTLRQALARVGADRVVAFSDVGLEHLPFGVGVLGMEVPLTRLPASWPAMVTVGNAVRSATRGPSTVRGGRLTRGSRAVLIVAERATDTQTRWSRQLADAVKEHLKWVGLIAETPPTDGRAARDLLASCADAAVVMFFGHASMSDSGAGLKLGNDNAITVPDVLEFDWGGKLVVLVGCETATQDNEEQDIAAAFLKKGSRAVVGTAARVSVAVADYLFNQLLQILIDGLPIDHAFFLARRRTAAFETLRTIMSTSAAAERIAAAVTRGAEQGTLRTFLDELGVRWSDVEHDSLYAPTFSLLGGSGETLV